MATINVIPDGIAYKIPYLTSGGARIYSLANEVDFQSLGVSSGDVVQTLPASAGSRILGVEVEIVTQADSSTSATLNVGDGADADGFIASANLKSATGTVITTPGAYGHSRRYTVDDTIDISPTYTGDTTQKGKVRVRAIYYAMT